MMAKLKNGGPAFPVSKDVVYPELNGMYLRDFFAAQIACGMASHSGTAGGGYGPGDIAQRSYEIADAMLKAREA